jgi:hypothetical protein
MLYAQTKEQAYLQGVLQESQESKKHQTYNKKRQYKAHHNNAHYTSDNNELHTSVDTPVPSEDPVSASSKGKNHEDENYHLHVNKKLKAGSHVPCKSDHQKGKKGEISPTFMGNDLDFTDLS